MRTTRRTTQPAQRRWGKRVRRQARREIMSLAETKRFWRWNDQYNFGGALPVNTQTGDVYIFNAFTPPGEGAADTQFIGNEIVNPITELYLTVTVDWGRAMSAFARLPVYRIDVYLVAVNEAYTSGAPIGIPTAEMGNWFVKHPGMDMRWRINQQNVVVIKRKRIQFNGRDVSSYAGGTAYETKTLKMKKRWKGKKTYEQGVSSGGVITRQTWLKGWNFYYLVINQSNAPTAAVAAVNPLQITGDHYLYFKDL